MTADDLLDPLIGPGFKGFQHGHPALRRSAIAQVGWNVLAGHLPFLAVLKRDAVAHNVVGLQRQAWHWGITIASVTQLAVGVAAAVRRAPIANQLMGTPTRPRSSNCCASASAWASRILAPRSTSGSGCQWSTRRSCIFGSG